MASEALRRDTILVVDDTPDTLGFLTDTLDHAGFTVLIATDGAGALDLVDQITPDLVLMDAVMPGMDGFETCRRLKREKLLLHLPVIFMTGLTQTEHVVEAWRPAASTTSPNPSSSTSCLRASACILRMRASPAARVSPSMPAVASCLPRIGPDGSCGALPRHDNSLPNCSLRRMN
jgi:DNA-binding response OmpR family regulator